MIRVNLLKGAKDSSPSKPLPPPDGQRSSFVSRREAALAGAFLLLGAAILWYIFSGQGPSGAATPSRAASEAPAAAAPGPAADPGAQLPDSAAGEPTPAADTAESTQQLGTSEPDSTASPDQPDEAIDRPEVKAPAVSQQPAVIETAPPAAAEAPRPAVPVASSAPAPESSSPDAVATLSAIAVSERGGQLEVFLTTGNRPEYSMFRAEKPNRVVIDLPNLLLDLPPEKREQSVSHPLVERIRIAQNQIRPPKVRLVLDVTSFPELEILPRANGLAINVAAGRP